MLLTTYSIRHQPIIMSSMIINLRVPFVHYIIIGHALTNYIILRGLVICRPEIDSFLNKVEA